MQIVDDQQVEAALALEPPRARGKLRHRQAAGFVDEERQILQLDREVLDAARNRLSLMPPRRIWFDGMPVCSAMMRVASCSADISSEKKPTMPPLAVIVWPSALHLAAPGFGDVVADVGGERAFAHAGAAGEDDQVGRLQAAHHAVEIVEPGGDARQLAVALVGVRRHVDRGGQRLGEALEAAVIAAGLGQLVELALGLLDLVARREIDRRVEGDVDHVLADRDQRAADRQVVDRCGRNPRH